MDFTEQCLVFPPHIRHFPKGFQQDGEIEPTIFVCLQSSNMSLLRPRNKLYPVTAGLMGQGFQRNSGNGDKSTGLHVQGIRPMQLVAGYSRRIGTDQLLKQGHEAPGLVGFRKLPGIELRDIFPERFEPRDRLFCSISGQDIETNPMDFLPHFEREKILRQPRPRNLRLECLRLIDLPAGIEVIRRLDQLTEKFHTPSDFVCLAPDRREFGIGHPNLGPKLIVRLITEIVLGRIRIPRKGDGFMHPCKFRHAVGLNPPADPYPLADIVDGGLCGQSLLNKICCGAGSLRRGGIGGRREEGRKEGGCRHSAQ